MPKDAIVAALPRVRITRSTQRAWNLDTLAGRFVEISGAAAAATLTTAASLILQAHRRGEPAAWIAARGSTFFPPDFAASGIDLAALPVVHARGSLQASRVADTLLRSGAFALVILDLDSRPGLPIAAQSRLTGLAKKHHTTLLCITRKEPNDPSLGSLVSIRGQIERTRAHFDRFTCSLRVVKDKRLGPGWDHTEVCCGTDGLC